MPAKEKRWDARLEAQDGSGHFRTTSVVAGSKAEATKKLEREELRLVLYELDEEGQAEVLAAAEEAAGIKVGSIDELPKPAKRDASDEEKAPFRAIDARTRARLCSHFQTEPYKVVSVKERK